MCPRPAAAKKAPAYEDRPAIPRQPPHPQPVRGERIHSSACCNDFSRCLRGLLNGRLFGIGPGVRVAVPGLANAVQRGLLSALLDVAGPLRPALAHAQSGGLVGFLDCSGCVAQDLVSALVVYRNALARGLGTTATL